MDLLTLNSLSKRYLTRQKGKNKKTWAVKSLTLNIPEGVIFGFLGPNGAGKTTTIKMIIGLTLPTEGEITIMGESHTRASVRKNVGFLPENPQFPPMLTANEFLLWTGKMMGVQGPSLAQKAEELLERVSLADARHKKISTFSKGMVQRLGIAQAILASPKLLILDEPLSGLDPPGRQMVSEILLEAKRSGRTVFFSSHILSDVKNLCDEVGLIIEGRLSKRGTVESVFNLSKTDAADTLDKQFSALLNAHA